MPQRVICCTPPGLPEDACCAIPTTLAVSLKQSGFCQPEAEHESEFAVRFHGLAFLGVCTTIFAKDGVCNYWSPQQIDEDDANTERQQSVHR